MIIDGIHYETRTHKRELGPRRWALTFAEVVVVPPPERRTTGELREFLPPREAKTAPKVDRAVEALPTRGKWVIVRVEMIESPISGRTRRVVVAKCTGPKCAERIRQFTVHDWNSKKQDQQACSVCSERKKAA